MKRTRKSFKEIVAEEQASNALKLEDRAQASSKLRRICLRMGKFFSAQVAGRIKKQSLRQLLLITRQRDVLAIADDDPKLLSVRLRGLRLHMVRAARRPANPLVRAVLICIAKSRSIFHDRRNPRHADFGDVFDAIDSAYGTGMDMRMVDVHVRNAFVYGKEEEYGAAIAELRLAEGEVRRQWDQRREHSTEAWSAEEVQLVQAAISRVRTELDSGFVRIPTVTELFDAIDASPMNTRHVIVLLQRVRKVATYGRGGQIAAARLQLSLIEKAILALPSASAARTQLRANETKEVLPC